MRAKGYSGSVKSHMIGAQIVPIKKTATISNDHANFEVRKK